MVRDYDYGSHLQEHATSHSQCQVIGCEILAVTEVKPGLHYPYTSLCSKHRREWGYGVPLEFGERERVYVKEYH